MSTSSINSLSSSYLQQIIGNSLENTGSTNSVNNSSQWTPSDNGQLSPFAQMLSELQQLQQSNPTEYQQVTSQIATNLQNAAQTAQTDGNTTAASQLTQLSKDFSTASQNDQLPNIQDLAQAVSGHHGHHGHHHHAHAASSDSGDSSSSTSTDSSTSSAQTLDQLLASWQSNATQNENLNPMNIILNTLSTAGINGSNS